MKTNFYKTIITAMMITLMAVTARAADIAGQTTHTGIQTAIQNEIDALGGGGGIVTVTSATAVDIPFSFSNVPITLAIPTGVTVIWQADLTGSVNSAPLIKITGGGTFKVTGGSIVQKIFGEAIFAEDPNSVIEVGSDGSVSATGTAGTAIYTYGNVTVSSGGTVSATGDGGTAIKTAGSSSTVNVSGGTVSSKGGYAIDAGGDVTVSSGAITSGVSTIVSQGNVTVSGGTISSTVSGAASVSWGSNVTVSGGTISAITGAAILSAGDVTVSGGMVSSATTTYYTISADADVAISGGFVFAYGNAITGTDNVVRAGGTYTSNNPGVVVAWDHTAYPGPFIAKDVDGLIVEPAGATAEWAIVGSQTGISYSNGSNSGFFPLPAATVLPLVITTPATLPNGTVGTAYSQTLAATSATPITSWELYTGALPSGLSLQAGSSTISGTPTAAGTFSFTIKASNSIGSNMKAFTITINPEPASTYAVTVSSAGTGASGGGYYDEGSRVNIGAGTPPQGMLFAGWITSTPGVAFADAASAATSFIMPPHDVTVTALFSQVPVIVIITQPSKTTTVFTGSIQDTLTVEASITGGATLNYQWFIASTADNTKGTAIEGATSPQFAIPSGLAAGTYYYYCVVSATNAAPVASDIAQTDVIASPPVPIFYGLADEYKAGSPAVAIQVIGEGSAQLIIFKVNGNAATQFNPTTAGTYLIEAASADGKLKIWKNVKVN
jgi:hypothetical protein